MKLTPVGDTVCDVLDTRGIKVICLEQGLRSLTDMDCRAVSFLKENRCHNDDLLRAAYLNGHLELLVLLLELLRLLKTAGDREARD